MDLALFYIMELILVFIIILVALSITCLIKSTKQKTIINDELKKFRDYSLKGHITHDEIDEINRMRIREDCGVNKLKEKVMKMKIED